MNPIQAAVLKESVELYRQFIWVGNMQRKLLGSSMDEAGGHWDFATDQGVLNFAPFLDAVDAYLNQKEIV